MQKRNQLQKLFQANTNGRTEMRMPKLRVPTTDRRLLTGYMPPLMRDYWK